MIQVQKIRSAFVLIYFSHEKDKNARKIKDCRARVATIPNSC